MKRWLFTALAVALTTNATASAILWAALDESSTIDGIAFRDYATQNLFVNAARLSVNESGDSNYSMSAVTQLALWIPYWGGEPQEYWEEDFPVTCLKDEDGEYSMGKWSSQFNLGDNPNPNAMVFFELGYVDWDDPEAPFITLATANATIQHLIDSDYTYQSGTIYPPTESNWMPTQFHSVPEPKSVVLAFLGAFLLLKRRKQ